MNAADIHNKLLSRRSFMLGGLAASSLLVLPSVAFASKPKAVQGVRSLAFDNINTGEKLKIDYWVDGRYEQGALGEINHILRDRRSGEVYPIDPKLLDLLTSLHRTLDSGKPFKVICGYRSPETNEEMHEHSRGVAKHSYHIEGKAIDIALGDRSIRDIRRAALTMGRGGVGYYPKRGFVHVDTGPVRKW